MKPALAHSDSSQFHPRLAVLGAVILWGGSFSAMRTALDVLPAWTVMWLRMIIALLCILPLARTVRFDGYRPGDWKLLLPTVLLQPCLYFWLESSALSLTSSAQAGVISASVPLLVGVGAWLVFKESMRLATAAGLALSLAGVAVLSLSGQATVQAPAPLLGNTLELVAMACAAANMLFIRALGSRYSPWSLTVLQVVTGCVFFSPGAAHLGSVSWELFDQRLILTFLFLGAGVTLGAFALYNWSITRMNATTAAAHINLIPVIAVGCGFFFLGETMTLVQMLAALTVLASVLMTQRPAPARR